MRIFAHRGLRCWGLAPLLLGMLALAARAAEKDADKDAANQQSASQEVDRVRLYIGTYTGAKSKGIYRLDLDLATGKLTTPVLAGEVKNPSFLAFHPNGKFLYSVCEMGDFDGKPTGAVSAFAIDAKTGDLKLLNQQPCGGAGPCHLVVDRAGKNVLVANYGGGSAAVLPIDADGKLREMSGFVQHPSGEKNGRKFTPHAHSVNVDAANRFACVADLGLDQVLVYQLDADKGTITANDPPAIDLAPGAGPRHFAFHPDGKHAYVINESLLTVTAMDYDPEQGVLKEIQTLTTLPRERQAGDSTAEVQVHPSGKFLYGSNRGHHSIAAFAIDAKTGKLTPVGHATEGIKTPRNFGMDPTGKYLIVANQDGDSLVFFEIDQETGALKPTGIQVDVPMPVCVKAISLP